MPAWICATCGVQYPDTAEPPEACPVCEDERQFVGWSGQAWTTMGELGRDRSVVLREEEPDLIGVGVEPAFAIGQRALLVRTPGGNVLWDCVSLLDEAARRQIEEAGGIAAICMSHPHFYGAHVEIADAFGARVFIPRADQRWIQRPSPRIELFDEDAEPVPGVRVARIGGHFDGAAVLHWPAGAQGRGALLTGDTITVVQDRGWVSFMWSYPNLIPLDEATVRHIAARVGTFGFDRVYGGWWGRVVVSDGPAVIQRSADRYIARLRGERPLPVSIRAVDSLNVLAGRLPEGAVRTDAEILRERAGDAWALGLLRSVRGDEVPRPAAVVFPGSTQDVSTVLAWASQTGTAVVPRGGGSGVCGGAAAGAGSVVLDLSRMDAITGVDLVSRAVHVQAGVRGGQLEEALATHGLTVGHYPQSIAESTVGGWIAASSAGQASTGFGAIEDVLLGLTAVLPDGAILRTRPVPRSAAGPDLRRLLVGSEGTLAVVTEATLACRARPAGWRWLAFGFSSFGALADGLREAVRAQTGAVVMRGYDETDAQLSFGALRHAGGCVGLLGFPAQECALDARAELAAQVMRQAGATGELGADYGEHWWKHRNDAVGTYQRIMGPDRAFGPGVIVDTAEVAGLWSAVPGLYAQVRDALATRAQAVGCHLSHLYPSGSSLYFTFLISGDDDHDAEEHYLAAWEQVAQACADVGGTLTHHHGVGRLKAGFLAGELGETGVRVLTGIKAALDPAGIMNPGVLLR